MATKKIRIVHIITRMDRGGAPDVIRLLVQKTDPALFDIALVYGRTTCPTQAVRTFLEDLGPRAVLVGSLRRPINPLCDILAFFAILRFLKNGRFDIVHTHTSKAGFLGRIAARLCGVPRVIHSPHGHVFYGYFGALGSKLVVAAERFASFFCDKIHVLTGLEKEDMLASRIAPAAKIVVIYCGIETELFIKAPEKARELRRCLAVPEDALVAGYVGRLEPVKGPKYFIRAAARVHKLMPNVRFLVAGAGVLRARLEREARRLKVGDCVHFLGWQEDTAAVYSVLDVLVLPSLNEAVGRTILEAQSIGVAVVAARVGGVPEIIQDRQTGLLVPARDPKAIAQAMISLLADPSLRAAMSEAGQRRVKDSFTDARMVEEFSNLYQNEIT